MAPTATPPILLLNQKLVDSICSEDTTPDEQGKTRKLYANMLARAFQSVDALRADLTMEERVRALHQLKGMLGNFGFAAAAAAVQEWEHAGGTPADDVARRKEQLRILLEQSKAELFRLYSWLG
ncbi:MAG: hypothetical protein A3G75_01305 [Verrucomicrobia bacterium RIFCSPLOWO2_12_FULL_64_8]|nr:MAG: hypothetical protein A3G75_01305 [Verrucomicrobia bacterium RIFCSPLOWO2_12_FULL_64_8]